MKKYTTNPVENHEKRPDLNVFGGGDHPGPGPPQSS